MSYQIKSTPYFRRMLTTSKQNGQLQRLKEEYERMRDFDDRTIEVKMRQVRLKRLFKEIEEIKELSAQSQHMKRRRMLGDRERSKTHEDLRHETLAKAKELGKEYSNLNGLFVAKMVKADNSGVSISTGSTVKLQAKASDVNRKQMLAKAISYGNQTSRANLAKITTVGATRKKTAEVEQLVALKLASQAKLKQRLSYGNNCSHKNIANRTKRLRSVATEQTRQQQAAAAESSDTQKCIEELRLLPRSSIFKTFEQLQVSKIRITSMSQANGEEDAHVRARRHWRKVALTVRFGSPRHPTAPPLDRTNDDVDNDNEGMEYRLRTISNETDLTLGEKSRPEIHRYEHLIVIPDAALASGEDAIVDEVLQHVEQLDVAPVTAPAPVPAPSPAPTPVRPGLGLGGSSNQIDDDVYLDAENDVTDNDDNGDTLDITNVAHEDEDEVDIEEDPRVEQTLVMEAKRLITQSEKVQKLAKIFEPFVRDVVQKEAFEGVQKLKSIFEH